jgi:hypothetical protein
LDQLCCKRSRARQYGHSIVVAAMLATAARANAKDLKRGR